MKIRAGNESKGMMSERNGDRARFQKNRKRKMRRRQRLQEMIKALRARPPAQGATADATAGQS
jgi:hypothetical protein